VDVIRHQAITQQVHGRTSAGVSHRLNQGIIIAGLVENGLAAVAPYSRRDTKSQQQKLARFVAWCETTQEQCGGQ
jgi:hypothetical protein